LAGWAAGAAGGVAGAGLGAAGAACAAGLGVCVVGAAGAACAAGAGAAGGVTNFIMVGALGAAAWGSLTGGGTIMGIGGLAGMGMARGAAGAAAAACGWMMFCAHSAHEVCGYCKAIFCNAALA
jgi:hypothetical protein